MEKNSDDHPGKDFLSFVARGAIPAVLSVSTLGFIAIYYETSIVIAFGLGILAALIVWQIYEYWKGKV